MEVKGGHEADMGRTLEGGKERKVLGGGKKKKGEC